MRIWQGIAGLSGTVVRLFRVRRKPAAAPVALPPAELTLAAQWKKISGVLGTAIAKADVARQFQQSAAQQLDLATYALYNLVDELGPFMSEPIALRRASATVYQLEKQSALSHRPALAA